MLVISFPALFLISFCSVLFGVIIIYPNGLGKIVSVDICVCICFCVALLVCNTGQNNPCCIGVCVGRSPEVLHSGLVERCRATIQTF